VGLSSVFQFSASKIVLQVTLTASKHKSLVSEMSKFPLYIYWHRSIDSRWSAVGITIGYRLDEEGVRFRVPVGSKLLHIVQIDFVDHPVSDSMGTGDISRGVKRPR
jgi:hypothetical protein